MDGLPWGVRTLPETRVADRPLDHQTIGRSKIASRPFFSEKEASQYAAGGSSSKDTWQSWSLRAGLKSDRVAEPNSSSRRPRRSAT